MEKYIAGKRSMECKQKQLCGLVRNKIKHRKKYKIGKSPTPLASSDSADRGRSIIWITYRWTSSFITDRFINITDFSYLNFVFLI